MVETVTLLVIACLLVAAFLVLFAVLTEHPMWPRLTIALILLTLCAAFVGVTLR